MDKIYMTFVQAMTGQGGWPLNVFISPDLKPFYGGTYWPRKANTVVRVSSRCCNKSPRPGKQRREQLTDSSDQLHQRLSNLRPSDGANRSF